MKKAVILYAFRRPILTSLREYRQKQTPSDIFYGLLQVKKSKNVVVTDKAFAHYILMAIQQLINRFVGKFINIGFSIIPACILLSEIQKVDLVFATVDTYGLPFSLFKFAHFFNKKLVVNTIGLYDGLVTKKNRLGLYFCRKILHSVDFFISGGSYNECKLLSTSLNIPLNKFKFIPFGIDTTFFSPGKNSPEEYILVIGADPSRDWRLYRQIAMSFPREKFLFVTLERLIKIDMPGNVLFEYNVPYLRVRELIWNSKIVLVLSKFNYHFAGQSTAFRSMSCGKPVIFTKTPGVEEYAFRQKYHCIMVPPHDKKAVISGINFLNKSKRIRKTIGKNARMVIKNKYNVVDYSKKIVQVFENQLNF